MRYFVVFLFALISNFCFSQSDSLVTNLKGTVIHNETKLPMGNVHVINASRVKGTVTSPSGTFEIGAKVNDTILFTYLGYETVKVKVTNDWIKQNPTKIYLTEKEYVLNEVLADMAKKAAMGVKEVTGVDTGNDQMNSLTGGWQPSDLIILAARPAMGKTAYALKKAINAAKTGKRVAIFSLEMAKEQLIHRILSFETGIALERIKKLNLADHEWQQLHSKSGILAELPIHWDDTPGLTLIELSAKAKRLRRLHGIEMIVIDYLQLITVHGKSRFDAVSDISRGLKILAKELNIPIIALSQLSRAVESRPGNNKRPMLSDLRESGSIEQDADMVMFIYRPEYYEVMSNEMGESTQGETHIRIAKHRNGQLDTIKLRAKLDIQKFEEWDGDGSGFGSSNWKPVAPGSTTGTTGQDNAKLFIQKESKMNEGDFDAGFDNETPF